MNQKRIVMKILLNIAASILGGMLGNWAYAVFCKEARFRKPVLNRPVCITGGVLLALFTSFMLLGGIKETSKSDRGGHRISIPPPKPTILTQNWGNFRFTFVKAFTSNNQVTIEYNVKNLTQQDRTLLLISAQKPTLNLGDRGLDGLGITSISDNRNNTYQADDLNFAEKPCNDNGQSCFTSLSGTTSLLVLLFKGVDPPPSSVRLDIRGAEVQRPRPLAPFDVQFKDVPVQAK